MKALTIIAGTVCLLVGLGMMVAAIILPLRQPNKNILRIHECLTQLESKDEEVRLKAIERLARIGPSNIRELGLDLKVAEKARDRWQGASSSSEKSAAQALIYLLGYELDVPPGYLEENSTKIPPSSLPRIRGPM